MTDSNDLQHRIEVGLLNQKISRLEFAIDRVLNLIEDFDTLSNPTPQQINDVNGLIKQCDVILSYTKLTLMSHK